LLARPQLGAAGLALDREGGAEPRVAAGTPRAKLAAALPAGSRQLVLELVEVALDEPAVHAERNPVSGGLPPLLAQPFRCLAHVRSPSRLLAKRGFARREPQPPGARARERGGGPRGEAGLAHAESPRVCGRAARHQAARL